VQCRRKIENSDKKEDVYNDNKFDKQFFFYFIGPILVIQEYKCWRRRTRRRRRRRRPLCGTIQQYSRPTAQ